MGKSSKVPYLLVLLGILLVAFGCGGDARVETNPSATVSIEATLNPDGTAITGPNITTVAAGPGAPEYLADVSATLPPNTMITAKSADGSTKPLTATPSLTFTAPADSSTNFSGTIGVPVPTGFASLASASGAVDVQLTGFDSATFAPAITITMPVPGEAVGAVVEVYSVAGTTYTSLGAYTVTTAGFVSFPVSSLSWKVANPRPDAGPPTTIATTIPGTTVGTTVPATTIATTVPGTTVGTTIPATTVGTTVPATTIATTVPATTVATTVPATTIAPTTTTTVLPVINGAALYAGTCQGCHGPLATPTRRIKNKTVAGIRSAGMAFGLSDAELSAIIAVLP